jgi:hypothetical protein
MLKATTLAIAIGAITLLFAIDASALPPTAAKSQLGVTSNTTLVRDDCGRGRHFSERRDKCVDNEEDGDRDRGRHGLSREERKQICQDRCARERERCNERRGGFFNGCGTQAAVCTAGC